MIVENKHIDFQGLLDGLHYLYYYEVVRHEYFATLGKSVEDFHKDGINLVLTSCNELNYKKSIIKDDELEITCEIIPVSKAKFGFYQKILVNNKVVSDAKFHATAVNVAGGRPFIPDNIKKELEKLNI